MGLVAMLMAHGARVDRLQQPRAMFILKCKYRLGFFMRVR